MHLATLLATRGIKFIYSEVVFDRFRLNANGRTILVYLPKENVPEKVWIQKIRILSYQSIRCGKFQNGLPEVKTFGLKIWHLSEDDVYDIVTPHLFDMYCIASSA